MFSVGRSGQVEIYKNRRILFDILAGGGKAGISVYFLFDEPAIGAL